MFFTILYDIINLALQKKEVIMKNYKFDFYSSTNLKSYNLDSIMKYQLSMLDRMDFFSILHSENVANLTCRICEYLHLNRAFTIHATICRLFA